MADELKPAIKRLKRLLQVRETLSNAAEAALRESEHEVHRLNTAQEVIAGNIRGVRAETAYSESFTVNRVQLAETYIKSLEIGGIKVRQELEKADKILERRRIDYVHALSQQRITEKILEQRLHESQRIDDIATQKAMDDSHLGKMVRSMGDE